MLLYPLRFEPVFQQYLWGGRRLETDLNKKLGTGETFAESWEIVDHGDVQSVVQSGPLHGKKLTELVTEFPDLLLGARTVEEIRDTNRPPSLQNRFPLLFKFLDCNKNLSVQVHPDDQMAATLAQPDLGKTEAWYVVGAEPGAKVFAGLKAGVTRDQLRDAIEKNQAESLMHSFEPEPGDCIFIPAGTVHALGAGLLIAEIQQSSNTTFRLYDWGRVDQSGQSRELHIEQGLEATNFELGPISPQQPARLNSFTDSIVDCDKFKLDRVILDADRRFETNGEFKLIAMVKGAMSIEGDPSTQPMTRGETCLVPASMPSFALTIDGQAEFLMISPG